MGLLDILRRIFGGRRRRTTVLVLKETQETELENPAEYLPKILARSKKELEFYKALFSQLFEYGYADPRLAPIPERSRYRWLKRLYSFHVVEKTPTGHIIFSRKFVGLLGHLKRGVEESRKRLKVNVPSARAQRFYSDTR